MTRRVNLRNIWQAVYTAGKTLPTPIGCATYWHRNLNPKKLVDVSFSYLPQGMSMSSMVKMHKLNVKDAMPGFRMMTKEDIPKVHALLNAHLSTYKVHINFNEAEIEHFLLPQEGVVYSFVVEDEEMNVTDFCSFYTLPSTCLKF